MSPLISRVAQRVAGRVPIAQACRRSVEYAPAVTVTPPRPPLHFEAELDRITGVPVQSSRAAQMDSLRGTTEFGPSIAYELAPMWMVDGNLASGRTRFELNHRRERLVSWSGDVPEYSGAAFASSVAGNLWFAHQILDDLPTALVAPDFGRPYFVNEPSAVTPHVAGYRTATDLDLPLAWNGFVRDSWVFRDPYLNDSKVARLRELRRRIAAAHPPSGATGTRVFLHRGTSGAQRAPTNEPEIERVLAEDHGWTVLDAEVATLDELLDALVSADIVAGVEGSQLAHLYYSMRPGKVVLMLMPPDRFNLLYKDFCDRLDLVFGFHVGCTTPAGWEIDLPGLLRLVDLAERTLAGDA